MCVSISNPSQGKISNLKIMLLNNSISEYQLEKQVNRSKGFRVGYDCIPLPDHFSGAAYYIFTLAEKLLSADREFSIAIICRTCHEHLFKKMLKPGDLIIPVNIKNNVHQIFFYEFTLSNILIKHKIRLFHSTHYICPPPRPEYFLITTFHDMGFCLYPNFYSIEKRFYFSSMMRTFLKRSDIVLTVSFSTADSVRKFFPVVNEKIQTVYPGTDHLEIRDNSFRMENLSDFPFFLAVNTLEKRKNTAFIIKVFNYLKEHFKLKHKLVIAGYPSNDFRIVNKELKQSVFNEDILIKHDVSEALLIQLYKQADCFLNASEYEGFGFTPIEAIRFGCPAFIYENNVTSELFPDYPYLLKEMNVKYWAKFIYSEMLEDFSKFKRCENILDLTWDLSAEKIINCYEKLLFSEEKNLVQI